MNSLAVLPFSFAVIAGNVPSDAQSTPAFPLKVSANQSHLEDQQNRPFLVMADTPWFIQNVKLDDVRAIMDDRVAKGFTTLSLETVAERVPSHDDCGNSAFAPDDDILKPVEAYWRYGEQVMEEAEKRGLVIVMSSLWFGAGKGMYRDRLTAKNAVQLGKFLAAHVSDPMTGEPIADFTAHLAVTLRAEDTVLFELA
jgi:hypothetical protein